MKKLFRLHPFLFALFPVINLYSNNTGMVTLTEMLRSLVVLLAAAFVCHLVLSLIIRNATKAGLILSVFLIFFFAYGHIYSLLPDIRFDLGKYVLFQNTILLPLWALALLIFGLYFLLTKRNLSKVDSFFNVAGGLLLAVSVVFSLTGLVSNWSGSDSDAGTTTAHELPEHRPDIYYIIMDGYARADLLQNRYGFDNTPFLDSLSARGFYVADSSYSNYCQTLLSLSSSLNLTYHDELIREVGEESTDRKRLMQEIKNNYAARFWKAYGYLTAAWPSGYYGTESTNADIYITQPGAMSEFEEILLNTTPIPVVFRKMKSLTMHRDRILSNLANLAVRPDTDKPLFVIAHIICPHPAFVFNAEGGPANVAGFQVFSQGKSGLWPTGPRNEQAYIDQVQFMNSQLLTMVDKILANSPSTVIVIQADHGALFPRTETQSDTSEYFQKFSILNAYRLPGADSTVFWETITPVNSFAVIFNELFGTDFEIVEDRIYWSSLARPFHHTEITEILRGQQ